VKNRIFVSIAAYRDPEVAGTLRRLLASASRPEALTIAIFDQSDQPLAQPRIRRGARIIIERCPPAESCGACWARARLQRHFDGEDFYLQLDAHHVFRRGWDKLLFRELAACPSPRPVLTGYLPPYRSKRRGVEQVAPAAAPMQFSHFDHDGVAIYRGHFHQADVRTAPLPARFFSGHFTFARREFVEEVPYDEDLYFMGEEATMAARAFTHGFDLFHPGRTLAWHHYTRRGSPRHWDDALHEERGETAWPLLQRRSVQKYRRIFCLLPLISERDGLGTRRTLGEYEAWAGVDHYWQLAHPQTAALQPPPAASSPEWAVEAGLLTQSEMVVPLPELASVDKRACTEVHVAVLEVSSRDAAAIRCTPEEYTALQRTGWRVRVRFRSAPLRLVVWPLIPNFGWGEKFERHLQAEASVSEPAVLEKTHARKRRRVMRAHRFR
jgi:hypothetical protein